MRPSPPLFLAVFLVASTTSLFAQSLACLAPQKPMLDIELLLGRGKASDARWRQFLARELTPRFPDGLTVYETTGQWRDPATKVITREKSRVLRMIVPADAPRDRIEAVAAAYKKQFGQKSVGIVMRPACVSF
jgi:hypothetical protein